MLPHKNYRKRKSFFAHSHAHWLCLLFALLLLNISCKKQYTKVDDYSEEFTVIFNNVNKYYNKKEPTIGVRYLDSAFSKIKHPAVNDKFKFYSFHFLYAKKALHNPEMEMLYADSMVYTVQSAGINDKSYVSNFAESNFAKGDAFIDLGQYSNAYRCFYQGYFIGKNYLDNSVLAEYTYRMGMVMFKQGHYETAANFFKLSYKQSFDYKEDFRAFYQRQELLNDIGESYQQEGKADSATRYFNLTLAYIDKNSQKYKALQGMLDAARAVTYGDQGVISYQKKQYVQATDQFKRSIAINLRQFNDNANAELVEINLAKLYLDQHLDDEFIALQGDINRQLDTVKNTQAATDWNKLMSSFYQQKKDFTKAYLYYTNYTKLKDSLISQTSSLKETDINQQQDNYEKQYQIENLKDHNKLQQIFLYLAILCVIMAVLIIFLVYRNWQRSKKDVLVISDLNRKINSQKQDLEGTLDELKINNQEKDRILRTVAHDLRNPIGGIVSLTNAMLDDEYNDEQKQLLSLVNSTSHNSLELINEILDATNNSIGKSNKEMIEINALVSNSIEILNFKAAEKDQKIVTELLASPKKLLISRERIWRVISNLISNAIKFSPNGAVINVKVTNGNNEIRISIADNGIGIPDEIRDEVFNIFTNAKRPGTAGEKSFGLGLSICQQIIENHTGKIWFENNEQSGTIFHISLPAA